MRIDFSIIIPHYNIPDCLQRLLNTIPARDNIEVIIIDDKSDKYIDDYYDLKNRYSTERCVFLDNTTEYKGAGVCRNIGIDHAKGKWLIFADADDYFSDSLYEDVYACVNREEDIIFFFPDSIYSDTGGKADRHIAFCEYLDKYLDCPNRQNELRLRYEVVSPWSKLVRRSMVVDNGIEFESTCVANDVLFCRKIGYYADKIAVEKKTIYIVTEREGSLTTKKDSNAYLSRLQVFIRSTDFVRSRIDKEDWRLLETDGSYFLHLCRINKMGAIMIARTVLLLLINGIAPFGMRKRQ